MPEKNTPAVVTVPVTSRIPAKLKLAVDRVLRRRGTSLAAYIRDRLQELVDRDEVESGPKTAVVGFRDDAASPQQH